MISTTRALIILDRVFKIFLIPSLQTWDGTISVSRFSPGHAEPNFTLSSAVFHNGTSSMSSVITLPPKGITAYE